MEFETDERTVAFDLGVSRACKAAGKCQPSRRPTAYLVPTLSETMIVLGLSQL
ncbi:hypothetical protein EIP91_004937 [Steccherinum ochraceum]|uniref:Uncharacterized protein n=1 Tax=Steccherinum ochraceum TaxID=92696 RepID=A0A4R0RAH8_9APHY|nr:hypothetical protein EIP91_004937 [Steccherinum ochraceum]